jgi:hypothetical protein
LKRIFFYKIGIDAHFGGIEAYKNNIIVQTLLNYFNKNSSLVIVTNEYHAERIKLIGGNYYICPDPLPNLSMFNYNLTEIIGKIFCICSFDIDEPYTEILKSSEILHSHNLQLVVSGNFQKQGISRDDYPHANLIGFVHESEFYWHLFTSQVVLDLTNYDNCLVCGAYEALEAGKPLVLTKKKALEDYFTGGTIFTENRADDIAAAVMKAIVERENLDQGRNLWVAQNRKEIANKLNLLHEILENC